MIDRALFLSADNQTFDGKRAVPNEQVTKLMLELADLQPGEKVLEIGTGSGYQTACLLETGVSVWSSDPCNTPESCQRIVDILCAAKKTDSVFALRNDGGEWKSAYGEPFDCIFVTCGMTSIPPAYEEQLRDGGRLVIPLGKPEGQELLRLEKHSGKLVMGRVGGYCRFQMAV